MAWPETPPWHCPVTGIAGKLHSSGLASPIMFASKPVSSFCMSNPRFLQLSVCQNSSSWVLLSHFCHHQKAFPSGLLSPCGVTSSWLLPSSRSMELTVLNPFSSKRGGCIPHCTLQKPAGTSSSPSKGSPGAGYSKNFGCMSPSRKRRGAAARRRGKVLQNPSWQARIQRKSGEKKGLEVKAARKSLDLQGPCDNKNLYFGLLT